jgi:hypothetical protein
MYYNIYNQIQNVDKLICLVVIRNISIHFNHDKIQKSNTLL